MGAYEIIISWTMTAVIFMTFIWTTDDNNKGLWYWVWCITLVVAFLVSCVFTIQATQSDWITIGRGYVSSVEITLGDGNQACISMNTYTQGIESHYCSDTSSEFEIMSGALDHWVEIETYHLFLYTDLVSIRIIE